MLLLLVNVICYSVICYSAIVLNAIFGICYYVTVLSVSDSVSTA